MNQLTLENFKEELSKGFEEQAQLINCAFQEQKEHFDEQFDGVNQRLDNVEERLNVVETKLDRTLYKVGIKPSTA